MKRRAFILIMGGAMAWPLTGRAQTTKQLRVGIVSLLSLRTNPLFVEFERELAALGYIEGQNLTLDFVYLNGQVDRYHYTIQDLVRRKVDIIIAFGPEIALKSSLMETTTLPIVMFGNDYDPSERGYVKNLARPDGNVTGTYFQQKELAVRRLQLFRDALPSIQSATVFWDYSSADQWEAMKSTQASHGLQLSGVELGEELNDYEEALAQSPPDYRRALIVTMSPFFFSDREMIAELAISQRIPAMFPAREFAEAGGLFSYGPSLPGLVKRVSEYVDKIARGAKPSELPIEKLTSFEIVVNLQTAETLGVKIPPSLLQQENETIEWEPAASTS